MQWLYFKYIKALLREFTQQNRIPGGMPLPFCGDFSYICLKLADLRVGSGIASPMNGGIMSHLKITLPAVILLGGFLVCSTSSYGKPEYTKATKKACAYCHVDSKAKPKELTAAGKYYAEHKNLDGYKEEKK
jgi:hypothetical protein